MNKLSTFLAVAILWMTGIQMDAQNIELIAPADLVVSKTYVFDLSRLNDLSDAQFGLLHDNDIDRDNVMTTDVVCLSYCLPNPYSKYPGLDTNDLSSPASLACDYFSQFYNLSSPDDLYLMYWGLDGYYEGLVLDSIKIRVVDLRQNGIGEIQRIYEAFDSGIKIAADIQSIWVVDCACTYDPEFQCQTNEVKLYFNNFCQLTILPEWLLKYSAIKPCNEYETIQLKDWITNTIIDRDARMDGVQLNYKDQNRTIVYTVTDPLTGYSCTGTLIVLDTSEVNILCPADTTVTCISDIRPLVLGLPEVLTNCQNYQLNYLDEKIKGSCALGYDQKIIRQWFVTTLGGKRAECTQHITVNISTVNDVVFPPDFDGTDRPSLQCQASIDPNLNVTAHYANAPSCVGGFILDSAYWIANSNESDVYPDRRIPKIFGWNKILDPLDINVGHPNPVSVYYPVHPAWDLAQLMCWASDQRVLWEGTGMPTGANCADLNISFQDSIVNRVSALCTTSDLICYEVYREWTVVDWCTNEIVKYVQKIHVLDTEGPEILYPDTLLLSTELLNCKARWEVAPPFITDNCSNETHYIINCSAGDLSGDETNGYRVSNLPKGIHSGFILASDCCGTISRKEVILIVEDRQPPQASCVDKLKVTVSENQLPSKNVAKVFANWLNKGSSGKCDTSIYFKIIRLDDLKGTAHGTNDSFETENALCNMLNGDDNLNIDGTQIYFDDHATFCCGDVGKEISVILRVFDRNPGAGPIQPERMSAGGSLENHFADCIAKVEVVDNSIPTLVIPPDVVVSCSFPIDISKLSNPNDSTFGKIVHDLSLRRKVVSLDKLCPNFCVKNEISGYPGPENPNPPSPPPASNRACEYTQSLYDSLHPDRVYELVWGFDGYSLSSCENIPEIEIVDSRKGGQGKITRKFIVHGPNSTVVTGTQTIWVVDCHPFFINAAQACDSLDDIIWPGNCDGNAIVFNNCDADTTPDNPLLGRPEIINNRNCNLITVDYVDEVILNGLNACKEIIRTWTVIDWNQYAPNLAILDGRWTFKQLIWINDQESPKLEIEIVIPAKADSSGFASVELHALVTDLCTAVDDLQLTYQIDEFNDGSGKYTGGFDYKSGPLSIQEHKDGKTPVVADNPRAIDPNNTADASGLYPVGIHKIQWIVTDACGNRMVKDSLFEVQMIVGTNQEQHTDDYFLLIPNPSQGNLKIQTPLKVDYIQLLSLTGEKLHSYPMKSKHTIELNDLPSGVYFVEAIYEGKRQAVRKLIVLK